MFKDCFSFDNLEELIIHIFNEFEDMTGHSASSLMTINAAITGELDFVDANAVKTVKAFLKEYFAANGVPADELEDTDGIAKWLDIVNTLHTHAFGLGAFMICPRDKAEEYVAGILRERAETAIDEEDADSALKFISTRCLIDASYNAAQAVLDQASYCCDDKFVLFI